jgi:four helix bundle protein
MTLRKEMEDFQFQFEKLKAWQEARKLVVDVYQLLEKFPKTENYTLSDQLRRAVVSVPSNIAEATGRLAIKEQIHFLEIAYASLMELYCQLQIAVDLGYMTPEELQLVKRKVFTTSKLISGLHSSKVAQLKGI